MVQHPTAPQEATGSDLRRYVQSLSGPLMLLAAIAAMAMANSPAEWLYDALLSKPLSIVVGEAALRKPILLWINEGLMTAFFLLVALEIKHEIVAGELSRPAQIALPGVAALAGIALPAGAYALVNLGAEGAMEGWAIPTATDIAFSLGALRALGGRVPRSLETFLMTVAVFDDIGAILIIAVFYASEVAWEMHGLAAVATLVLFALNRLRVTRLGPYFIVGGLLWLFVLKSGVHATLAGVVLGFTIPYRTRDALGHSPLERLEHSLHPYVALFVLPVFAFANAGVDLTGVGLATLAQPVTLGIVLGLVVGKTGGIFLVSAAMVRLGMAPLPQGASWMGLLGVSALAGIGFTMSLFLGTLAFEGANETYATAMRLGVLAGSLVAAALGVTILLRAARAWPTVAAVTPAGRPDGRTPNGSGPSAP